MATDAAAMPTPSSASTRPGLSRRSATQPSRMRPTMPAPCATAITIPAVTSGTPARTPVEESDQERSPSDELGRGETRGGEREPPERGGAQHQPNPREGTSRRCGSERVAGIEARAHRLDGERQSEARPGNGERRAPPADHQGQRGRDEPRECAADRDAGLLQRKDQRAPLGRGLANQDVRARGRHRSVA